VERLVCSYCGIPFRSRGPAGTEPVYCCSGCAMASRMSIQGSEFPVTPQLVFGLVLGFAIFNQLLLLVLSLALVREERADTAALFAGISAVLGVVVFAAAFVWQLHSRLFRTTDVIAFAHGGVLAFAAVFFLTQSRPDLAAGAGIAATTLAAIWQMRGMIRKWIAARFRSSRI